VPIKLIILKNDNSLIMGNISDTTGLEREIADLLATHQQPDVLLPAIAQAIGVSLAVDAVWTIAIPETSSSPQVYNWSDRSSLSNTEFYLPVAEIFPADKDRHLDKPLALDDLAHSDDLLSQTLLARSLHSCLITPILSNQATIGYILLAKEKPHQWQTEDTNAINAVSTLIAIAIEKSRIYQKYQILERYQSLIPELATALAKNSDKQLIFQLAIASTAQALQVEVGLVLVLKYDSVPWGKATASKTPKAKITVAETWLAPNREIASAKYRQIEASFEINESNLALKAYKKAPKPLIVSQAEVATDKLASLYPQFPHYSIAPLMSASQEAKDKGVVLGFLVFQHSQTRTWQPEELSLINGVSKIVSTAIVQSQTISQINTLVDERTAQLQSSLEVQAMLYEKTRRQLEQLRQAKKAREEFIDSISHELRTPLTAMNLAIKMLRQPGLPDERRINYFNILEQQCNQEITLVNDLLDWGRLESKQYQVQVQTIDLHQLLSQLAHAFAEKWTHKGLKLELGFSDSPMYLETDQDILKRILAELLTNAGKYSIEESTIYVKAALGDRHVFLSVTNTGNCIPPEEKSRIFEPLHRPAGTAKNAIRGTGLGLALVRSFVQHLNGTIEVSSESLSGGVGCETCFTLTLPQTPDNF
jgi:signal transduction histidine kinase